MKILKRKEKNYFGKRNDNNIGEKIFNVYI